VSLQPSKIAVAAVVSAVLMGGPRLYAQDTGGTPDTPPDVAVSTDNQVELSAQEMIAQAEKLKARMQEHLKRAVVLQQIARKQKDVIKLNCVNDKLLQIKQLMNIGDTAQTNMHEAIAQNDDAGRYHEYGKIVIAEQQVSVLAGEAEACIGEELVFLGPTEVTVEEPEMPDDPTDDDVEQAPDFERPSYASPFN
jgi:hypothetical protein